MMCQGPIDYLNQAEDEAYEGNIEAAKRLLEEADTCTQGYHFPDNPEYGQQRNRVIRLIKDASDPVACATTP